MSNIRDLQRLRITRNVQNPEGAFPFKLSDELPNFLQQKSPSKQKQDTFTRLNFHKRGSSFGNYGDEKKASLYQTPRISIYNFSSKLKPNAPFSQRQGLTKVTRDNFFGSLQNSIKRATISPVKHETIAVTNFSVTCAIGKGGFGKVWKVQHKKTRQVFAMKEMSKAKVILKKSVSSVMNERDFLCRLSHPFIVNMTYAFQDRENLYLIMDYLDGGDLRYHLGNRRHFSEKETKFFMANLIIGLQYLHRNKIIHRDIKPQNLVLDSSGYMRITDLGVSREYRQNNQQDTSGTPGYMAPEVMSRKEHNFTADFFAMGVMAYEFMLGQRPYQGQNRKQIREQMLMRQAAVRIDELPFKWSPHSLDFVNRLLIRNPDKRLGANGIDEIKDHPWLADVDWNKLLSKKVRAPFTPLSIEEDYQSYREQISEDTVMDQSENTLMLRKEEVQRLFDGYYFEKEKGKKSLASEKTTCTDDGRRR